MQPEKITIECRSGTGETPGKTVRTAVAAAFVFHAMGFAALAAWSSNPKSSLVRFAGREQAFHVTLSLAEPQWDLEVLTDDEFETAPPVVIEPHKARISQHTFVPEPTVRLTEDELFLAPPDDFAEVLPEVSLLDEVHDRDLHESVEQPAPETAAVEHRPSRRESSPTAIASPSSRLGNTEDLPPDLSHNAPPPYPAHALQKGWEGTVLLRVWVDEAGRVTRVEVARSSGHPILDGAAATAVRHWSAVPANRGGKPVKTVELLPVRFRL